MQCTSRLGVDEMEHLRERYERAEARIEEAKDRYDRMRAVGRMYEMSWKNPYAAFRAGEISELGLFGRTSDHLEAANMYMRAHRLGDTRATWRLISEHPCSADPEEADARSERLFMEAALPVRIRRADGSWLFEQDDGFMEEAESRADGSAWVRRMLAHAKHIAGDPGCRHWAELSARDGDAVSKRILAEWLIDDAYQAEDSDDGRRSFAEAMSILNSLDDDWRAHMILGREAFCSRFAIRDDAVALDHFLRVVSLTGDPDGRSAVLPYLEYYAAFPGCAEETEPSARTIAFLIDKARELGTRYVLNIELSSALIARTIAEEAGCGILVFSSMHNITLNDYLNGETYLSLMEKNADVLREALS